MPLQTFKITIENNRINSLISGEIERAIERYLADHLPRVFHPYTVKVVEEK